jgi:hypothetical protein
VGRFSGVRQRTSGGFDAAHGLHQVGHLAVLAARRTGQVDAMPCPQTTMPEFKKFIGFEAIEALQAHYEMGSR